MRSMAWQPVLGRVLPTNKHLLAPGMKIEAGIKIESWKSADTKKAAPWRNPPGAAFLTPSRQRRNRRCLMRMRRARFLNGSRFAVDAAFGELRELLVGPFLFLQR